MSDIHNAETPAEPHADAAKQSIGDTAVNVDPQTQTLVYGDWSVKVADLPAKAIAYLLQNGFSQSMTDAAALTKAQKQDEHGNDLDDDTIAAKVKSLRDARFARIVAGEVGVRAGGPKATGIDALIRTIAVERLRVQLAKYKLVLPSGKDKDGNAKTIKIGNEMLDRETIISRYVAKNGDELRAEADRRRAEAVDEAEMTENLDDILG